jgi:hypothetical protein
MNWNVWGRNSYQVAGVSVARVSPGAIREAWVKPALCPPLTRYFFQRPPHVTPSRVRQSGPLTLVLGAIGLSVTLLMPQLLRVAASAGAAMLTGLAWISYAAPDPALPLPSALAAIQLVRSACRASANYR